MTRLAAQAPAIEGTCVVDLGAGTGYYLASVLGAVDAPGIALDISKPAARHAAHAHPRVGAVVADVWQPLPIRGRAASVLLNVFSPRNAHEMRRILHPEGRAVVVVPEPDHLRELVEGFGLLHVDERKAERLEAQFADRFAVEAEHIHRETLQLSGEQAATLIGMGPNAWHARTRAARGPVRRIRSPARFAPARRTPSSRSLSRSVPTFCPAGDRAKMARMRNAILAGTVTITGHEGHEIEAYAALPQDDAPRGGVVLIHHLPGYDEATREYARTFAVHGYNAVVPNLYTREGGPGVAYEDAAAAARAAGGVPDERLVGDIAGGIAYLRGLPNSNGKAGTIGHCSGGRQAVLVAARPTSTRRWTATARSS